MEEDEKVLNEILNTEKDILVEVLDSFGGMFIENEFIKNVPVIRHICDTMGLIRKH